MTDLLDGLRSMVPDRRYALDELAGTQAYEWALNDVREVLRNPTDEQVDAIAGRLDLVGLTWMKVTEEVQDEDSTPPYLMTSMRQRPVGQIVRAVLTAAAGGER